MEKMWPFQAEGVNFIRRHRRVILADQMGIGKTRQAIEVLKAEEVEAVLVICSKNAMFVWERELRKWWPEKADSFLTTEGLSPHARQYIWTEGFCIITTHQILLRDFDNMPKQWAAIVLDEPHKWLRNRNTKTFRALRQIDSDLLIMMTGTPASRGAGDLWPMLRLCDKKQFSSYWRFVSTFCYVDDSPFGKEVYGTRNLPGLKTLLSKYMIRRLKADVFPQMPPKLIDLVPVEMTRVQRLAHDGLLEEMIAQLDGKLIVTQNTLTAMIRLRQMLVCPRILNPDTGYGAGIEYLQAITFDLDPDDRHFVVFTPFKKALIHIGDALEEVGAKVNYMSGGMSLKQIAEQVDQFDETRSVMVCVIKCAPE